MAEKELNIKIKTTNDNKGTLEFARDLTVVVAGIKEAFGELSKLTAEFVDLAKKGAEFKIMRDAFYELNGGIKQGAEYFELLRKASAGALDDSKLILFANKFRELGIEQETTVRLMDFAERNTEKFGGTIEEVNSKVLKFIETGKGKGFEQYGIDIQKVNKLSEELAASSGKVYSKLSAEQQQTIRTTAFLQIYGDTLENIKNKQKDNADIIASIATAFENAKLKIGEFISGAVAKLVTWLGVSNEGFATFITVFAGVTVAIIAVTAAVYGLVVAFGALDVASGGILLVLGAIITAVAALTTVVITNWDAIVNWYNSFPALRQAVKTLNDAWDKLTKALSFDFSSVSDFFGKVFVKAVEVAAVTLTLFVRGLTFLINGFTQVITWGKIAWSVLNSLATLFKNAVSNTFIVTLLNGVNKIVDIVKKAFKWINSLLKLIGKGEQEPTEGEKGAQEGIIEQITTTPTTTMKGGKTPSELRTEQLDTEAKMVKTLADQYSRLNKTIAEGTIEPRGFEATSKSRPADKNTKAEMAQMVKVTLDQILRGISNIFDNFSRGVSALSQFFGAKGKEFINDLVNGFQRITAIVDFITSMIETAKSITTFLSLLIPGAAEGGLISGAGTGTSDSIPTLLSNGEYVVNARATSQFLPLLQAINGNTTTLQNYGRYAQGGLVKPYIQQRINLEVADVRLRGSDLYLSWRRQDRLENNRKG